jgi:hypothetical protein
MLLISTSADWVQALRPRLALVKGYDFVLGQACATNAGIAPV